ncbi:MAG: AAA family ATPase, partial [Thermoanaerobaculia bacterium]
MVVLCDPAWWPEEAPATPADDLHALGVVFYRVIAGEEVEPGRRGLPSPPSRSNPEVGIDLDRVILKLLHPDPRRRYQEAGTLFEDLRRICSGRAPQAPAMAERFLDRRAELENARARLEARRPAAISVSGEAGMGKSVFLRRLAIEGQLLGYRTASVRCFPESAVSFAPLRSLAEGLLAGRRSTRSLRSTWRNLLGKGQPEGGVPVPGERSRFLAGLINLFFDAARDQPCLLMVDEAHLADSLTIEFLARLIRDVSSATSGPGGERPVVTLAVAYRPEAPFRTALKPLLAASSAAGEGFLTLELGPFSPETVEELLLLSGFAAGPETTEVISRLEGHPLFLWETIRLRGLARGERPVLEKDLDSLHELYLTSLAQEAKAAVEALAVLGRPAPAEVLSAILALPPRILRPSLETLVSDGTLSHEGVNVFFQHGSFRAWILDRLEPEAKNALHGMIASILEARGEAAEEIAEHWLRSDRPGRAATAALNAARRLAQHHQNRKALELYQAVLDHLPSGNRRTVRAVAEEAAEAFSRGGEHRRAAEVLKSLLPGCRRPRDAGRLQGRMGIFCH